MRACKGKEEWSQGLGESWHKLCHGGQGNFEAYGDAGQKVQDRTEGGLRLSLWPPEEEAGFELGLLAPDPGPFPLAASRCLGMMCVHG